MVDITPLVEAGQQVIHSYAPGQFRITNIVHTYPVIVFPDNTQRWDITGSAEDLSLESFDILLPAADKIDILLVGCGTQGIFAPALKEKLKAAAGIAADFMDTGAACRTYNVLMAEGRLVAAALLPV